MDRRTAVFSALSLALSGAAPARAAVMQVEGARIDLTIDGEADQATRDMISHWVTQSAEAVRVYYGKFPVPSVSIKVMLSPGEGVRGGQTFPGDPPRIRMRAGAQAAEWQLMKADWVMVHEMIHLAFPWMDGEHNWMAEGIAVYVESIARVQAGHMPEMPMWNEFVASMPKGLPKPGDKGIDKTVTWGRTYWGGALFCLMADVAIHKETANAKGLRHALRAINSERNFSRMWPFRETLEIGDRATGRSVLVDQYDAWKETPVSPDLPKLWADLGIKPESDSAPLAAVRKAILTPM